MKKVCHITTSHRPKDPRIFMKECMSLARTGQYSVSLVVPSDTKETSDEVNIVIIKKRNGRLGRWFLTNFEATIVSIKQRASIYHFHDIELILTGLLLRLLGKKVIFDSHEDFAKLAKDRDWVPKILRLPLWAIVRLVQSFCVKFFSGVVAATPSIAKNFPPEKTVIVENFPLLDEFEAFSSNTGYRSRQNFGVYAGSLSMKQGVVEMIKSAEQLKHLDYSLLLAGWFETEDIEKQCHNLSGWDNTNFYGTVPRAEVRELFSMSRIALILYHPAENHFEAQPIKIFELMAAGLPLVVSNFDWWRELMASYECGLCADPLNPDDIAEKIAYLLENPEIAQKMGENGRKAVEAKINWTEESKKLLSFYDRISA